MAQNTKKPSTGASASKKFKRPTTTSLATKRGSRVIAPKKQKLIAKNKLIKKHTAGLTALTERSLAEKAGHLELLAGGKKDRTVKAKGADGASKK